MSSSPPKSSSSAREKALSFSRCVLSAISRSLPWLLIITPAVFLFLLMRDHLVNIPYLDDFMFQPMFEKAAKGFVFTMARDDNHLTLHDFFLVQMEHRMAFVRAIIMLRHHFWPHDITVENWFTFGLLVITAVNVGVMLKKTAGTGFKFWWPLMALASFAIFSPVQYQIVLWAMMFQVAVPACALSTTLVALMSNRLPIWAKWLIGVVAAECATLSFAAGILVWLLPLPAILWGMGLPKGRVRWYYLGIWLLAFAVTMALYFHDLHNEVDGPFAYKQDEVKTMDRNVGAMLKSPGKSILFVLHFVGGTLGRGWPKSIMTLAYITGLLSLVLLLVACLFWLRKFKNDDLRERLLPWICFGSYSFGAASMVAMGRVWATSTGDNAISPRYTIHTVPLTISLVVMGFIVLKYLSETYPTKVRTFTKVAASLFTVIVCFHVASWFHGRRFMETWESARLRMATNTMFFKEFRVTLHAMIAPNKRRARDMDDAGTLGLKMTHSNMVSQFKRNRKQLSETTACWTDFTINTYDRVCTASGYACLRHRHRVADGVFLTYKDQKGEWVIFTLAQVQAMPIFLSETIGRDLQNIQVPGDFVEGEGLSGFRVEIPFDQLPKAPDLEVAAWAFDFREKTAYPMAGRFRVDTVNGFARRMDKNLAPVRKHEH